MSLEAKIDVTGLDQVVQQLGQLSPEIENQLAEELETLGQNIEDLAKVLVPVRTGFLRASIYHQVHPGPLLRVYTYASYAWFVEFGTRFMHPRYYLSRAIQAYLSDVFPRIDESVNKAIKKVDP